MPVRFGGRGKAYFVPTPIATPKEPSRRVRCDWCSYARRFDDWSDEIRIKAGYLAFLKKHGAHFDEKYLWD